MLQPIERVAREYSMLPPSQQQMRERSVQDATNVLEGLLITLSTARQLQLAEMAATQAL